MLTISLVGQKGGGGKSTCCWILAQAVLARPGNLKVLLIETDSQGSTIGYVSAALTNYPDMAERLFCERATTADEVYELIEQAEENGIDYVIVDTEGRHSDLARGVMVISDKIIIPVKPVTHEYRSQLATAAVYETVRDSFVSQGETPPPCGMLLNNIKPSQKLTVEQAQALGEISQHPMILPFFMPNRSNFETLGEGRILVKELEALTNKMQGFKRKQTESDLTEAENILKAIEGMS
ncbi:AAA family ATPase [Paracoccus sp. YIM 132242]|uniref:AAA family ATPase n=1 Tax=Paracoccus lichenicola TaxID=2665644 RepID=A0A6L6HWX9_9RHOB|nr:ParA family protein [Paracoccus lichenicola]MTE01838.1 AAA family ATPase [Paracoccus lichenicola]